MIGAGPAGATAARRPQRRRRLNPCSWRSSPSPRYKACGGGVPARTLQLLNDLDIAPVSEGHVDTIDISRFGQHQFRKTSNRPLAWMVMRDRFDGFLTDLAAESGASVQDATPVQSIVQGDGCYDIETPMGAVRSRHILAADGATGPTACWLNIDSAPTRSARLRGRGRCAARRARTLASSRQRRHRLPTLGLRLGLPEGRQALSGRRHRPQTRPLHSQADQLLSRPPWSRRRQGAQGPRAPDPLSPLD